MSGLGFGKGGLPSLVKAEASAMLIRIPYIPWVATGLEVVTVCNGL